MTTTICYCFGVSKEEIEKRIADGESIEQIRGATGMGWGCGGCNTLPAPLWGGGCNTLTEPLWGENATEESRKRILDLLARQA